MTTKLEAIHPVLMSRDVPKSIQFYQRLGFKLLGQDAAVDPKYARMERDGVELDFQWHDAKEWDYPNDRPSYRFAVSDVDGLHAEIRSSGVSDMTDVSETPWGTREFHVSDADLNLLQFYRWREEIGD